MTLIFVLFDIFIFIIFIFILGGLFPNITNSNANNITTAGTYFFVGGGGAPSDNGILNVTITGVYANGEKRLLQYFAKVGVKHFYIRQGYIMQGESPVWNDWCELTTDLPSFYKNYSDLSSLASALGVQVTYDSAANLGLSTWSGYMATVLSLNSSDGIIHAQLAFHASLGKIALRSTDGVIDITQKPWTYIN